MSYELNIGRERPQRECNGRFLPGHVSPQKGRRRSEWLSPESEQRIREATAKRLREQPHPINSGRPKRKTVAILCDGRFIVFNSAAQAAEKSGIHRANISKCCRCNKIRAFGNSDHHMGGIRWYYEDDNVWLSKINK